MSRLTSQLASSLATVSPPSPSPVSTSSSSPSSCYSSSSSSCSSTSSSHRAGQYCHNPHYSSAAAAAAAVAGGKTTTTTLNGSQTSGPTTTTLKTVFSNNNNNNRVEGYLNNRTPTTSSPSVPSLVSMVTQRSSSGQQAAAACHPTSGHFQQGRSAGGGSGSSGYRNEVTFVSRPPTGSRQHQLINEVVAEEEMAEPVVVAAPDNEDVDFDVEQLSSLCLGAATPSTVADSVEAYSPSDQQQQQSSNAKGTNTFEAAYPSATTTRSSDVAFVGNLHPTYSNKNSSSIKVEVEDKQKKGNMNQQHQQQQQLQQQQQTSGQLVPMMEVLSTSSGLAGTASNAGDASVFGPAPPPELSAAGGLMMPLQYHQQTSMQQPHDVMLSLPPGVGSTPVSSTLSTMQPYLPAAQISATQVAAPASLSLANILFEQQNYDIHEGYYTQGIDPNDPNNTSSRGSTIRPRTMSTLQTVLESNTKRLCYGETTTTTTTMAKTEELVTIDPSAASLLAENRFSTLEFEGGTFSHLSHLNVENCYSYAWRRWSKTDAPLVNKTKMSGSVQVPHTMIKDEDNTRVFQYVLGAPTASGTKIGEMTMTYLNQGQSYEIRMKKLAKTNNEVNMKTTLRVSFVEKRLQYREEEEMLNWSALHSKDRLLDIDFTMSYGVFDINTHEVFNHCIQFLWNPGREASIFIKVNCISTEFTSKRHGGERGAPLRLVAETAGMDDVMIDTCSCLIKVFKSKGAERKHKTDRDRVSKHPEPDVCFLPSYDCTLFTTYKDEDGNVEFISANLASGFTSVYTGNDIVNPSKKVPTNFASILAPNRGNEDLRAVAAMAAANVKTQKAQRPFKQAARQQQQQQQQHSLQYSVPLALPPPTSTHQQQQQMTSSISSDLSPSNPQALPSSNTSGDLSTSAQQQLQILTPSETSEQLSPTGGQQFEGSPLDYELTNMIAVEESSSVTSGHMGFEHTQQQQQQSDPCSSSTMYQESTHSSPMGFQQQQPITSSSMSYQQTQHTPSPSTYQHTPSPTIYPQATPSPSTYTMQQSPSYSHLAQHHTPKQHQHSVPHAQSLWSQSSTPLQSPGPNDSAIGGSGGSTFAAEGVGRNLPDDADAATTSQWLVANRFHRVVATLAEFTAEDLRDMKREELIELCEAKDGIRLYNRLHKAKTNKLTIFISLNCSEHFAIYLSTLTMEHFKAKLLDSFNDPTIVIRQIHLLGPKGIKVKLTDQVVENIANETIYECQLIQVGDEYDALLKIAQASMV